MANESLQAIRTRRVVRHMTAEPIDRAQLIEVLQAAHWAPSAGNRRLQRFVAVQRPETLRLLRMVSLGMFQQPAAVVVICIDWQRVAQYGMPRQNTGVYMDVGTALQTILLAAHAIGLDRHRRLGEGSAQGCPGVKAAWESRFQIQRDCPR
jgi:nitroreductase